MDTSFFAILVTLAAALTGMGVTVAAQIKRTEQQVARLERKLDRVLEHLGLAEDEPEMADVRALIVAGRKIHAIKRYREITGAGLAEAKEAVERMENGVS